MQQLRLFGTVLTTLVFSLMLHQAAADDSAAENAAPGQSLAGLIEALDSPEFAERQRATRGLAQAGQPAVEPLLKAAQEGSLEVVVRGVLILESIYTNGGDPAVDAAEIALERLATSENRSAAVRAEGVLTRHADYRQQRALAHIEKLGATIRYAEPTKRGIAPRRAGGRGLRTIGHIELTPAWTGGDEGLKYFKRLNPAQRLLVYRIEGQHVSDKAIQELEAALPNLVVQNRGPAILGVTADTPGIIQGGCLIKEVRAGSAAQHGGLRDGDVITRFGEREISSFDDLVDRIKEFEPGDEVQVTVLRGANVRRRGGGQRIFLGGKPLELKVVLKGWTE